MCIYTYIYIYIYVVIWAGWQATWCRIKRSAYHVVSGEAIEWRGYTKEDLVAVIIESPWP